MRRSLDRRAFLATLGANAEFYAPFQENARRWYRYAQERVAFVNHAIIHPPVDRDRPIHERADVCVHAVDEKDNGIVVSGAKVVSTGSALTHAIRERFREETQQPVEFVYLRLDPALAAARVRARQGHFAKADLVASQFETLEEPKSAITVDAASTPEAIVAHVREALAAQSGG